MFQSKSITPATVSGTPMYVIYVPLSVSTTHLEISRCFRTRSAAFAILVSAGVWVDVSRLHHVAAVGTKGAPDKSGVNVLRLLMSRVCHCESRPTVQYDLVSAGLLSPYVRLKTRRPSDINCEAVLMQHCVASALMCCHTEDVHAHSLETGRIIVVMSRKCGATARFQAPSCVAGLALEALLVCK
jgi:hypothetical protein